HLGALRTSDNETTSTTLLTSTRLLLRALHVIDSELVEGRHVTVVDGESTLDVLLGALEVISTVFVGSVTVAFHLERGQPDQPLHRLELRVANHGLEGRDRRVEVASLLVVKQGHLCATAVKPAVSVRRRLELLQRLILEAATQVRDAGVVERGRQRLTRS